MNDSFGYKLRLIRKSIGLSQTKLAAMLEMSQAQLSGIESNDKDISKETLDAFLSHPDFVISLIDKEGLIESWSEACGHINAYTCDLEKHQRQALLNMIDKARKLSPGDASQIQTILNNS